MKNVNKYWLVMIVSIFLSLNVYAQSPVWKVSKGTQHLYIGGTIHILSQSDYPLPPAFEQAYNLSTKLVLEADIQAIKEPQFAQRILGLVKYSDGRNLKQVLNPETFAALTLHLNSRGIAIEQLMQFKPGMVALSLTMVEMQRLGLAGTGVDEFFVLRSINDKKSLGFLETAEQQMKLIAQMGEGKEDDAINYMLRDIELLPVIMKSLKAAWRIGDQQTLIKTALIPMKKEFPNMYDELLVKRNNAWLPQIETMLTTAPVELVLVGALHLAGDDSVLSMLISKGYNVKAL